MPALWDFEIKRYIPGTHTNMRLVYVIRDLLYINMKCYYLFVCL